MWCVGDEDEIAALKRSDLNSIGNFIATITGDFGKHDSNGADGERLKKLAIHIYQTMFFNPRFGAAPDCPYHGTREYRKYDLSFLLEDDEAENSENGACGDDLIDTASYQINPEQDSASSADPFERRVEKEQLISQDLLKVLEYHAKLARREILAPK
ncbi:hypothetical protein IWW48_006302 [Coemansia sp. RSA 1200]|nr:hypothetical protein IWW48_006302 [Coemansia sp. RSA 1200]